MDESVVESHGHRPGLNSCDLDMSWQSFKNQNTKYINIPLGNCHGWEDCHGPTFAEESSRIGAGRALASSAVSKRRASQYTVMQRASPQDTADRGTVGWSAELWGHTCPPYPQDCIVEYCEWAGPSTDLSLSKQLKWALQPWQKRMVAAPWIF